MRNILLTASLVTNLFTGVMLHAFLTGHMQFTPADYATQLAEATPAMPVHLPRK